MGFTIKPCPICGKPPMLSNTDFETCEKIEYKCFCSGNSLHISCGDWFDTDEKAYEDWNRRTEDVMQPDLYKPTNYDKLMQTIRNIDVDSFSMLLFYNSLLIELEVPIFETEKQLNEWLKSRVTTKEDEE